MARDYTGKETPNYVRGMLMDSIQLINTGGGVGLFCHYCGSNQVIEVGCHLHCTVCEATSEGCGD